MPLATNLTVGNLSRTRRQFSESTLGVAVPFFTDIGLIARNGSGFVPSGALLGYNQAVALSASEAKRKLRPLFETSWFYRVLAPRLQLNSQPVRECVGVLAVEAKAGSEHLSRVEPLIGFLELAGIVSVVGTNVSFVPSSGEPPPKDPLAKTADEILSDQEDHSLYLDKNKQRKFSISSPLFISRAEYNRICKWIEVTLIVEDAVRDSE